MEIIAKAKPKRAASAKSKTKAAIVPDDIASAWFCSRQAQEKKAEDVVIGDLRKADSAPSDFFVICSCNSTTHVRSVAEHIKEQWAKQGWQFGNTEGWDSSEWIILDYFDVVVHIFLQEKRDLYKLEKLWSDGIFYSVSDAGELDVMKTAKALSND